MQSVILGTAQWGLAYGATNAGGRLSDEVVRAVVREARSQGIVLLDTAPGYGDAEERIGLLAPGFGIQTKASIAGASSSSVRASILASLDRLRRDALAAVLVHDWTAADPVSRAAAAAELSGLREEGVVAAVGISGYSEADVVAALEAFTAVDVVQVPVSLLDQRLVGSAALAEVRSRGGRVQARSVFLQGAALASADHPTFGSHSDVVRLRDAGQPLELCLGFVRTLEWVDEVVLAVTTEAELEQVMRALRTPGVEADWTTFASADPWLLDPRQWTAPTREG